MVHFELNSNKSMNILDEILKHSGGSIASFGGSLAVVATFAADLSAWVAICGGALGLLGGALGMYSKIQEIKLKNLQMIEFQKSIERDAALFEQAAEAGKHDKMKREIINEMK